MYLEKLQVQGIRNIHHADMELSEGANLFFGLNGSGKTSILEAVHILSRGRSFRTRNLKTVINLNEKNCTCFGQVRLNRGSPVSVPVGVTRDNQGKFVFKVNGSQVTSASQLADALPVQIINAESFQLLEGSPGARRGFLDWGVFHVEHSYRELWSRFQRCLKHRNSLLRHGKMDPLQLAVWDREFSTLSRGIDESRRAYLDRLRPQLHDVLDKLGLGGEFEFRFVPGWDHLQGLEEQLSRNLSRDQKAGFTQIGPHRADLKILSDGQMAADILSRGQIKTLVVGLKIAQGRVLQQLKDRRCIYLLDDLPSELDENHRRLVAGQLSDMKVQVLVTGVDRKDLEHLEFNDSTMNPVMFHVKHGQVAKI